MSENTTKKSIAARRLSPKVRFEGGGRKLTSLAGLVPVIKFLDALGFSGSFRRHERRHNAQYQLVDALFLVLAGLMGGARSIGQCVVLWSDEVLQRIAGWLRIPDESTGGRPFKEVGGYPGADHVMRGGLVTGCHQGLTEEQMAHIHETADAFMKQYT